MYDANELNRIATGQLKELYEIVTGNELRRHSDSWEGACPVCGGDNRFWIKDSTPDHGYCRGCQKAYKGTDIVMGYYGLSFYEACNKLAELLGVSEGTAQYTPSPSVPNECKEQTVSTMPDPPAREWQTAVMDAVIHARDYLWSDAGIHELNYLRGRGFTDKTIRDYWLGFNPQRYCLPVSDKKGNPIKALTGFWMPTFLKLYDDELKDNVLMRVKVRTENHLLALNPDYPKYLFITGSKAVSLFCAQYARPRTGKYHPNIIYVEGEFDAMTINQTAGDICKAVTFGAHGYIGSAEQWQSWYRIPENTVICFDNDSDPKVRDAVRKDEEKLQANIIKAQSLDDEDIRANAPVIRHLPDEYHDWNDILQLPDGAQIIRNKLTEFFSGDADDGLS